MHTHQFEPKSFYLAEMDTQHTLNLCLAFRHTIPCLERPQGRCKAQSSRRSIRQHRMVERIPGRRAQMCTVERRPTEQGGGLISVVTKKMQDKDAHLFMQSGTRRKGCAGQTCSGKAGFCGAGESSTKPHKNSGRTSPYYSLRQ